MTAIDPSLPDLRASRALTRGDLRTLGLAALGGALEFYDFIVFVFFASTIGALFFPPDQAEWLRQLQTWGVFAAGYLARPLGGILMGHHGDRSGRKRMFLVSVLLMAVPTLVIGLLPTWEQIGVAAPLLLLAMRLLQGAAVGGEVPGAWTFVAEHVPPRHIGFACGTLTAGLTAGILIGSLAATAVHRFLSAAEVLQYGWRLPFLIGGVFGLGAMFLRRLLAETPVFEALRERRQLATRLPLAEVLTTHRPAVLTSMLLTWLLTAAIVVVILMTPTLLAKSFGIPPASTLAANSLATLALTLGCVFFGVLGDRIGAWRALAIGCVALAVAAPALYLGTARDASTVPWLHALAGFAAGVVGAIPALLVRAFPPAVRFSGLSFSYNVAYAICGGLTPPLVTLLASRDAIAPAWYVAALCGLGIALAIHSRTRSRRFSDGTTS